MECSIADKLEVIRSRVAEAARRAGNANVRLVAVSKTVPLERVKKAIDAGVSVFGENRVQEAADKWAVIGDSADCHLIGHLQTNKVKSAVRIFQMIHSVDSLRLAQEIDRRSHEISKVMPVLVQVNVAGEETKFGIGIDEVAGLVRKIREFRNLRLEGLMAIPPYSPDPESSRPYFRRLAECRNQLEGQGLGPLPDLSMGMSGDYEVAIEEGATYVRVGSALFGDRF